MTLNIPDRVSKLMVLLGLILIGYSTYKREIYEKSDFLKQEEYLKCYDSINISLTKSNDDLLRLSNESELLLKQFNSNKNNTLINKDSLFTIIVTLNNKSNELIANKKSKIIWDSYLNNELKIKILKTKLERLKLEMDSEKEIRELHYKETDSNLNFGYTIFILGLLLWVIDEYSSNSKPIEKQNEKVYKCCQSCGKNFTALRSYSHNKDMSLNFSFCKECFLDGEFTDPNLTKEDFLNEAKEKLKNKNWLKRNLTLNKLYFLDRWKEDEY